MGWNLYGELAMEGILIYMMIHGPSSTSRKILTPGGNSIHVRVSNLIDHNTGTWNEPLIRANFFIVDVNRILKFPLVVGRMEDFVSWNYTKTGIFTV
jgi:hypothetical protein